MTKREEVGSYNLSTQGVYDLATQEICPVPQSMNTIEIEPVSFMWGILAAAGIMFVLGCADSIYKTNLDGYLTVEL